MLCSWNLCAIQVFCQQLLILFVMELGFVMDLFQKCKGPISIFGSCVQLYFQMKQHWTNIDLSGIYKSVYFRNKDLTAKQSLSNLPLCSYNFINTHLMLDQTCTNKYFTSSTHMNKHQHRNLASLVLKAYISNRQLKNKLIQIMIDMAARISRVNHIIVKRTHWNLNLKQFFNCHAMWFHNSKLRALMDNYNLPGGFHVFYISGDIWLLVVV